MAQGTSGDAAWAIAQGGFGVTASQDAGWFGKGIYFTSELKYAEKYSELAAQQHNKRAAIVISAVITGNPFPVIEHPFQDANSFLGKTCQIGYQSHCVCGM